MSPYGKIGSNLNWYDSIKTTGKHRVNGESLCCIQIIPEIVKVRPLHENLTALWKMLLTVLCWLLHGSHCFLIMLQQPCFYKPDRQVNNVKVNEFTIALLCKWHHKENLV